MLQSVCHNGKFFFDKEAANRSFNEAVFYDSRGGSVRTVSRSECVVYVNIAERRKLFAEFLVSALFARVETKVFEENAFALFKRGDFSLRVVADDVELMSPRGAAGSSNGGAQATDPAHDPVRNNGHETEPYAKSFARGSSQQTSAQPVYAAPAPVARQQTPPPADVYDEDIPF